jgi:hypothetical protein
MKFHGDKVEGAQLELLALGIDASHRAAEPELMRCKWFDYRRLHPTTATYLFAHHYKQAVRTWAETTHDLEGASKVRAFAPADIFKGREATAMWNARACADSLGMPYDLFFSMTAQRAMNQLWSKFPRPNQLYGEEVVIDLKAMFDELCATTLVYSRDPWFKVPQFFGHAVQLEHREHVLQRLQQAGSHPGQLARMFHEQVLDPRHCSDWFSPEVIEAAQGIATRLATQ